MTKRIKTETRVGPLGLDSILETAIEIANRRGPDRVSIRAIAGKLDVSPMSIYGYVDSKDDLLDKMAARMVDTFEVPVGESSDWGEQLAEILRSFYQVLLDNPSLVRLLATRRLVSVGVTRKLAATLSLLRSGGLSDDQVVLAEAALYSYVLGSADFVLRRTNGYPGEDNDVAEKLAQVASSRNFEIVRDLSKELSEVGRSDVFEFGITLMIAGIRAHAEGSTR